MADVKRCDAAGCQKIFEWGRGIPNQACTLTTRENGLKRSETRLDLCPECFGKMLKFFGIEEGDAQNG